MRSDLHDLWGCGCGPVARLAPETRILTGAMAFGSCMAAPVAHCGGLALIAVVAVAWTLACWPPRRVIGGVILLGALLLAPYFLLSPWMGNGAEDRSCHGSLAIAAGFACRGLSGMLISAATVMTLTMSDLREGLMRLPLPGIVSAILVQIVHQTAALGYETRRVAAAMSVRGASGGGLAAWRVLASLPQVWLPRLIVRAERVAEAMEVRGYCDQEQGAFEKRKVRIPDALGLVAAACSFALALALRFWRGA